MYLFYHVMGAKYMWLLASLRKTVVSNLPLHLINKAYQQIIDILTNH